MKFTIAIFATVFLAIIAGCTWVKLSESGAAVAVLDKADPECKHLGNTNTMSKAQVASIDRNKAKVATELETLARNQAATMGGNVVVARGPVTADGQRSFAVYHCPSVHGSS